MRVAVVFPGQGSQFAGMADAVDATSGRRSGARGGIRRDGRDSPRRARDEAALATTEFVQPALLALDVAAFRVLRGEGRPFVGAAGHSLGEFAALVAAEVLAAHRRVRDRGRARAARCRPRRAAAGHDDARCSASAPTRRAALCDEARGDDVLVVANENSPQQVVISGSVPAIERAEALAARAEDPRGSAQRRRSVPLPADGARASSR